ncbi:alpha-ketoacid dehydrogenase subunit beta [Azospirillum rugosum]|uniref:Pyruvate dehydrogenase E1 component beta subunit n=1 Tax=Azospirillum rugosum TaxID=416170 RepID=A0ABS4SP28_9PROT|nr:transketolase C-terminal domain-containing protein [Azospirillum rugosum]MBP2294317.1 pyruvate dehydrogenase E1 component beta subunit [Azospirillum rugosum]MDQ0527652.1 pyruvate dehydrogenase E1 component beta subunit [Azospirillum rugosum]
MRNLTYAEALSEGLVQAMEQDPAIFVTGIAVDYSSGIFGTTVEALRRFGPSRVFDAPAMENALTGIAIGAAAMGKRPVVVHPRNDFMFLAFDQLINLAAKWRYMYGGRAGRVPVVVRAVVGKGWGQGATHSQSLHATLAHFPGLKVVLPALPADAKGLTLAALQDDGPVVILEHRSLFGLSGPVPEEPVPTPLGVANVVRAGTDVTVVAASLMVVEALRAAAELEKEGVSVEVVDIRSVRPLDEATILASVRKTGRLLVADTSWELYGVSSEVAALAAERAFADLKGPVRRLALANCPAPVSAPLEAAFYPKASTIATAVLSMLRRTAGPLGGIDPADDFKGPY